MSFKEKYDNWVGMVNISLEKLMEVKNAPEETVYNAMKYSIDAGGKRLRPVLAIAVCDMLGGNPEEIMPYACAIEMIHTYSLIHDDLPAMDNDDYRRGKLTNHKVFGEAMAILAGDALLNYAFEIMLEDMNQCIPSGVSLENKTKAVHRIAKASGRSGMIGGQVVDLESEGKMITKEVLEYMHRCKTGALIKAPVLAAAALCNANHEDLQALDFYAEKLGLAFQIKDDILDVEGDLTSMGKMNGSDMAKGKSTFVSIYGLEESKKILHRITHEAAMSLEERFGEKAWLLKELAQYLINREN